MTSIRLLAQTHAEKKGFRGSEAGGSMSYELDSTFTIFSSMFAISVLHTLYKADSNKCSDRYPLIADG